MDLIKRTEAERGGEAGHLYPQWLKDMPNQSPEQPRTLAR
jgi:hypothetical protein